MGAHDEGFWLVVPFADAWPPVTGVGEIFYGQNAIHAALVLPSSSGQIAVETFYLVFCANTCCASACATTNIAPHSP